MLIAALLPALLLREGTEKASRLCRNVAAAPLELSAEELELLDTIATGMRFQRA